MKFAHPEDAKSRKPRRGETVILFCIGEENFAIAAGAVQEIRSTDSLAGASSEFSYAELEKVRHTLQRGKMTYYVVTGTEHFHMAPSRASLVLILRGMRVAVLVDRMEGMAQIARLQALPRTFCGEEQRWYRGLALLGERVVPVVEPGAFLSHEEIGRLDRALAAAGSSEPAEEQGAIPA